jgi:methionine synthase II (cobalamin-independent)
MNKNTFIPNGLPTLIGSLPAENHQQALDWILESTPVIPLWPQLPAIPQERMLNQFIEGIPGIVETAESVYFDCETENFYEEQLAFFEEYLQVSEHPETLLGSRFRTSPERASGLHLLGTSTNQLQGPVAVKGQITGPFTMLTGITDTAKRLGYYEPAFREVVVKGLALKAAWQVLFLKQAYDLPVLLFIDEPAMAGLGSSSFISISIDDISQDLAEVTDSIHGAGGLVGVHVCANTDWHILLSSAIDIISFDAYSFFDKFITCKKEILGFLDRNGIIAWGIIPTSEAEYILQETPESLIALWEKQAALLVTDKKELSSILSRTIITPSCGTGSLTPDLAKKVLMLTREVSAGLRKKYIV